MTLTIPEIDDLAPLGFSLDGQPIWPVFGSERDATGTDTAPDTEEDDDSDDDDDTEEDDGSEDDEKGAKKKSDEEWKPPTRDEWERQQRALNRMRQDSKRNARRAKEATSDGGDEAARKASEEAEKKFKPVAVRSAAKAALLEAGLNDASDTRMKKLMRMIDMDDVEVDDDGDVLGLDDQIDAIKDDFPALFEAKKDEPKKRATKLDAAGRKSSSDGGRKLTVGEQIARQMMSGKG